MKKFLCVRCFTIFLFFISCVNLIAQEKVIKGTVTDEDGLPLLGVSVIVKGTSNGTVTNMDGEYSIDAETGSILVFSFMGMRNVERLIGSESNISITMVEDQAALDEVLVIAYGEQSRTKVTGAIQKVNTEELQDLPVSQVTQKLQGKLAGVNILQNTGTPGGGMSVRIRGQASISAGSNPLYVVDGFPITGDISNINPDEIESITVLKDASSTSLYGSRAANGVVMVTTKRAKEGKLQVSFNAYSGMQQIPEKGRPDLMNAREFAQFKNEYYTNNGLDVPEFFQNPDEFGEGTNWFNEITRTAPIQNYSLSLNGGSDRFKTSAVLGYFKQDGVLLNSEFERISLRANLEYEINDRIKVGANVAPTWTSRSSPQSDGTFYVSGGIIQGAMLTAAVFSPYNEDGTLADASISAEESGRLGVVAMPNWLRQIRETKNDSKNIGLLSNVFLEAEVIPNLTYKIQAGVDLGSGVSDSFTPAIAGGVFNPGNPNDPSRISASHGNNFGYSWLIENTLNYNNSFKDHNIDILAGYTSQAARGESGFFFGTGFPDEKVETLNAATTITGATDIQEWSLASVFGRFNYNFKDKYLLSAAIRSDGSSKFGSENRWGTFPSVSAGWLVSNEAFLEDNPTVSFLKLRASYGVTGNNNIGNYTQYSNVVITNNPFNDVLFGGKSLDGLNNQDLGWERTAQTDLGLELGLFNDRIGLIYDYYYKETSDLLYSIEIPISSGFYNYAANIGDFKFWGHEITLTTKNFIKGDFRWTSDYNIAFNRNEAVRLGTNDAPLIVGNPSFTRNITRVGEPLGQLYGLEADGLFLNQSELDNGALHNGAAVGTIRFVDQNGDGIVTNDERDWTVIGNTAPDFIFGFTQNFVYKNFDLTVIAQGSYGNKMVNSVERFTGNLDGSFNVDRGVANRYFSEENPGAGRYGITTPGTTGQERDWFHSKFVYDASYLTIKNITLGYNIPTSQMDYLSRLRVYASVQQPFVFTDYPGPNPEVSVAGGVSAGTDTSTYPVPRTFSLGLNISL